MKLTRWNRSTVAQQAAEWTEALKSGSAQEREAFDEWLMESPRHVREFLQMSAVDRALDSVDSARQHDVQALLVEARSNGAAVLEIYGERRKQLTAASKHSVRWFGLAAAMVVLAVGAWGWYRMPHWQDISTAIGEQRTVQLSDGTVVALNTQSHLQLRYTSEGRDLRLLQGQASFKVSRDTARPFRVQAGQTLIQALGTEFDVYRREDAGVKLAVVEGQVKVSSLARDDDASAPVARIERPVLSAGEELSLAPDGKVVEVAVLDKATTMAWHQRRLVFRRDTLATVIEEFNRYNRRPQFKLEDVAIADRHYSGEFDADDPESLLKLLAADARLSVVQQGDVVTIRAR